MCSMNVQQTHACVTRQSLKDQEEAALSCSKCRACCRHIPLRSAADLSEPCMQSVGQQRCSTSQQVRCWRAQLDAAGDHPGKAAEHCCRWLCQGAAAAAVWRAAGPPRGPCCPAGCPPGLPQLPAAATLGAGAWEGAPGCPLAEPSSLEQDFPGTPRQLLEFFSTR